MYTIGTRDGCELWATLAAGIGRDGNWDGIEGYDDHESGTLALLALGLVAFAALQTLKT